MSSCEALLAYLPHSLISKALRYLKMKIHCQRKINEYFLLTPRMGIKACVVMIPLLGVTWLFGLLSPVHKAFVYIFTILNSAQVSVRW